MAAAHVHQSHPLLTRSISAPSAIEPYFQPHGFAAKIVRKLSSVTATSSHTAPPQDSVVHNVTYTQQESKAMCGVCCEMFRAEKLIQNICTESCSAIGAKTFPDGVCRNCIETSIKLEIDECYHGKLPRICCLFCQRRVALRYVRSYMNDVMLRKYFEIAVSFASIRCYGCENRRSLLTPHKDLTDMITYLESKSMTVHQAAVLTNSEESYSRENVTRELAKIKLPRESMQRVWQAFQRFKLARISAAAFLDNLSQACPGADLATIVKNFSSLLEEDFAQQATLLHAYYSKNPLMRSPCCQVELCYACRATTGHDGQSCEEYAMIVDAGNARDYDVDAEDLICKCPACGIQFVKGDGCSYITCICGAQIYYNEMMHEASQRRYKRIRVKLYSRFGGCFVKWIQKARLRLAMKQLQQIVSEQKIKKLLGDKLKQWLARARHVVLMKEMRKEFEARRQSACVSRMARSNIVKAYLERLKAKVYTRKMMHREIRRASDAMSFRIWARTVLGDWIGFRTADEETQRTTRQVLIRRMIAWGRRATQRTVHKRLTSCLYESSVCAIHRHFRLFPDEFDLDEEVGNGLGLSSASVSQVMFLSLFAGVDDVW